MKTIRLSGHVQEQLPRRGVTEDEIVAAIRGAEWQASDHGRLECRLEFAFANVWNKKFYKTKQVRPIFVDEATEIVVITVYSYFY
jgi:hypothetical protein